VVWIVEFTNINLKVMKKILFILILFCVALLSSCVVSRKPTTNLYRHELKQQRYYKCIQTIPYTYKAHEKSGL
jgi:hypothetical protein